MIKQEAIAEYKGTVITVSHDRYFIRQIVNRVVEVSDKNLQDYSGDYNVSLFLLLWITFGCSYVVGWNLLAPVLIRKGKGNMIFLYNNINFNLRWYFLNCLFKILKKCFESFLLCMLNAYKLFLSSTRNIEVLLTAAILSN